MSFFIGELSCYSNKPENLSSTRRFRRLTQIFMLLSAESITQRVRTSIEVTACFNRR
jgi:hypothetical protein